jgi:hypothetical protein
MNQTTSPDRDLAARLQRLEDVESICRLKAAYCAACDDDHDGDTVAGLFVEDGTWDTTQGGNCRSHDDIRTYFGNIRASGRLRYSTHMVTNPVIDITGDEATGTWSLMMMFTGADDIRVRILGFYRERYVRTDAGWRFRSLFCEVQDNVRLSTDTTSTA